jgi:hypothetical protein
MFLVPFPNRTNAGVNIVPGFSINPGQVVSVILSDSLDPPTLY